MPQNNPPTLLTLRSALVLALSLLVAVAAAGLTYWSTRSLPQALIAAGIAAGGALVLFNTIIE
ncbi:hypothetical protein [Streptomyces sp. NPDC001340]